MKFLSSEDVQRLRDRVKRDKRYIDWLEKRTADVRRKLYIQESGLATWVLYFVCPKCAVTLKYDYNDSEHYVCPICGGVQTGEPFKGAWWDFTLNKICDSAEDLAILYVATEREEYLNTAREILLGYADNYHNYEVHGGIPYNNPGRMAAQTLSDSNPLYSLAVAYGLIVDRLTEAERKHITEDLFRPGAAHLMEYITPQIHNHEVMIASTIAAIGFAIDDESLVDHAVNDKYGLKYQIDNAYLEDGFWFECSTGYHNYSMSGFMRYEKLARYSKYSLFADDKYREKLYKALLFTINLCDSEGMSVKLNDGTGQAVLGRYDIYEYAYSYFGTEEILWFLNRCYGGERLSVDALLWGVDDVPIAKPTQPKNYFAERGSGIALIKEGEHTLLMKSTPFGGEHDHYDRLGISYAPFGKQVSVDFGTAAGYGTPLHYGYFKNTATHNTVVIDGENMAPCDTRVNKYVQNAVDDIYLDAETMPPEEYKMLDSFTIKQWSDEAYKGVRMRRVIDWQGDYFIDVFSVKSPNKLRKEWTWHVFGENTAPKNGKYLARISDKKPQSYITNAYVTEGEGIVKTEYLCDGFTMDVYTLADGKEIIYAEGPNNPADTNVSYLLERSYEENPIYVNVIESYKTDKRIESVKASVNGTRVSVTVTEISGRIKTLDIEL